jgi:patatin-like phospholipase/acyl hydrolase
MKYVLSLDGGGVRGFILMEFLICLENYLSKKKGETVKLNDLFDVYVGSSIGGIMSILFGSLEYSANESQNDIYNVENIRRIMNKSCCDKICLFQCQPKYAGDSKTEFLEDYFPRMPLNHSPKQVIVTSYDITLNKAVIYNSKESNIDIVKLADITSAAPTYYPCVKTPNNTWAIDGGVAANHPAMCALAELEKDGVDFDDIKVLSIGTGFTTKQIDGSYAQNWGVFRWLKNNLINVFTNGPSTLVDSHCRKMLGENYLRINSHLGDASPALDDTSTKNINKLKQLGRDWFYENIENIDKFFGLDTY